MADNPIKYTSPSAAALAIAGDASTQTLKGLTNNAKKIGGVEIDPAGNLFGSFTLRCKGASAFTSGTTVDLYLIPKDDGTNYSDGDDSVVPSVQPSFSFAVRADTTQHRLPAPRVPLPATPFKCLIIQKTGATFSSTNDENQLHYRLYTEQVVTP